MESSFFAAWTELSGGVAQVTIAVSLLSLLAVWWPLMHGALLCWRARAATTVPTEPAGLEEGVGGRIAELIREVQTSTAASTAGEPEAFVRDAAKQLVVEEYESSFAEPISMYSNLLPPIGFIGTVCGLALLLYSMRMSDQALQLGGLAMALSSTIFALVGYAILEAIKIHLYGRLARSIDAGLRSAA
ncbi:MAG: MotA/TolQ/ExbB proton channel family protein [Myxococcota bacterium]